MSWIYQTANIMRNEFQSRSPISIFDLDIGLQDLGLQLKRIKSITHEKTYFKSKQWLLFYIAIHRYLSHNMSCSHGLRSRFDHGIG